MSEGVDYAFGRLSAAQLRAGGKSFVIRYLPYNGDPDNKGATAAEVQGLRSGGISVGFVFEIQADRALGGSTRGAYDAINFVKPALAGLGIPKDRPVYFAVDFDASPTQQLAIDNYLKAAGGVLGAGRVGVYAGFHVVERCAASGSAHWFWQTYAWSGGMLSAHAHVYQYNIYASLSGVAVDLNRGIRADFGQWMPPAPPSPAPSTGYGLPGWPTYAQSKSGAEGYAYRIFVNAGKARLNCAPFTWGAAGWPWYARLSYAGASAYALRVFKNNPNYKP